METNQKVVIYVYYPIEQINACFKDSLYQYLLKNVWGRDCEVEEDIRVMNEFEFANNNPINVVRYQFGNFYDAEERMEEIGELVNEYVKKWLSIQSNFEEIKT